MTERENPDEDPPEAEGERSGAENDQADPESEQSPAGGEPTESSADEQSPDAPEQEPSQEALFSDLAADLPIDRREGGSRERARESGSEEASSAEAAEQGDAAPEADAVEERTPTSQGTREEGAPLEEMADDVRRRRQRRDEGPESDPFEQMDVGEVDGEVVWEELLTQEELSEAERAVGAGVSATEVGAAGPGERTEHVVPKDEFCSRCPYLTDPPMLACDHDGTEIVEVTDADHFRVRGCPFAGREEDELAEFE